MDKPFLGLCCLALRAALGGGWTCLVWPLVTLSPGSPESIECVILFLDRAKKLKFLFCCGVGFSVVLCVIVGWYSCEVEKASQYRGSDDIKLGASGVSSAQVTNGVTRHIIALLY